MKMAILWPQVRASARREHAILPTNKDIGICSLLEDRIRATHDPMALVISQYFLMLEIFSMTHSLVDDDGQNPANGSGERRDF